MTEAEVKARKILSDPHTYMISHDLWGCKGVVYRIVDGAVLDHKQQLAFDDEMRRTGKYEYPSERETDAREFEEALRRARPA
jgi:hypothetical protein